MRDPQQHVLLTCYTFVQDRGEGVAQLQYLHIIYPSRSRSPPEDTPEEQDIRPTISFTYLDDTIRAGRKKRARKAVVPYSGDFIFRTRRSANWPGLKFPYSIQVQLLSQGVGNLTRFVLTVSTKYSWSRVEQWKYHVFISYWAAM